jgi:asparagine synthetase A
MQAGEGLCTEIFLDQRDWEKGIHFYEHDVNFLKQIVNAIWKVLMDAETFFGAEGIAVSESAAEAHQTKVDRWTAMPWVERRHPGVESRDEAAAWAELNGDSSECGNAAEAVADHRSIGNSCDIHITRQYHQAIVRHELPLSIGGGMGQ